MGVLILVVDDDADWRNLLSGELCKAGFEVTQASTGAEALTRIHAAHFDLMILDVHLPDRDGYAICEVVRRQDGYVPIIMISGIKKDEVDHEFGLDSGADHYFKKPVSARVIVAQVWSLLGMVSALKKNEAASGLAQRAVESDSDVQFGVLHLDFVKGEFKRGDQRLALTALEIKLLACLHQNVGRVMTVNELLQKVWRDRSPPGKVENCRLKNAINRLRRKIEPDPKCPRYLLTKRGGGYYLCLDPKSD